MHIAEIGEKYHVTQDTLRYYERIGLIPYVNRSRGGIRDYTEEDERWVEFTTCMRNAGYGLFGAAEELSDAEVDHLIRSASLPLISRRGSSFPCSDIEGKKKRNVESIYDE